MSFVHVAPELLSAAASSLQGVGDTVNAGIASAAVPTTGVVPPAADPVSGLTTSLFSAYAQAYQAIAAEAAAVHEQFVTTMSTSANSYATAEATNTASEASTYTTTEIEGVLKTWVDGAMTSPVQVYLSVLVPYLLGIVTPSTALTFAPPSPAPAAALVAEERSAPGPDHHWWPGSASGSGALVSAESTAVDADMGRMATLGRAVETEAFSALPSATTDSVISPESALLDTDLAAAPPIPVTAPGSLYSEPSFTAPAGQAADSTASRVGTRSVILRSPSGG